jgi:cytosine/adenosine deaminase-related metal-dependent hydrolase
MDTKKQPKFGDMLHIKGAPHVFLQIDSDGDYEAVDEFGERVFVGREVFDEYAPNPYEEQRERILKRWKGKSLDNMADTEESIINITVDSLVDFVIQNIVEEGHDAY